MDYMYVMHIKTQDQCLSFRWYQGSQCRLQKNKELETVTNDIESEYAEQDKYYPDDGVRYYYGKRYERNPINRKRVIAIRGLSCIACAFNLGEIYGFYGKYFTESASSKQFSILKEEADLNPAEDQITIFFKMLYKNTLK